MRPWVFVVLGVEVGVTGTDKRQKVNNSRRHVVSFRRGPLPHCFIDEGVSRTSSFAAALLFMDMEGVEKKGLDTGCAGADRHPLPRDVVWRDLWITYITRQNLRRRMKSLGFKIFLLVSRKKSF